MDACERAAMAADDVRTNYHLTPHGWVKGATGFFQVPVENKASCPPDTVVTYEAREYKTSAFGVPNYSVREAWRMPGADDQQVLALLRKHGPPADERGGASLEPWKKLIPGLTG